MIELKNVFAGYGKKNVIENACFSISRGKLTCIIGRNGSGKSTLLKVVSGLLKPTDGQALVDGKNILDIERKEIAKLLSYLSQSRNVPEMSVGQMVLHGRFPHISYPCRYGEKDFEFADNAMTKMGLSEYKDIALSSLSGGMRQKAYIAMALAQNTDYILLDEPTTFLDVCSQIELMQVLRTLANENKGIVIVMHDLPLAFRFCDEIVLMDSGRIVAVGSPAQIYDQKLVKVHFGVDMDVKNENEFFYKY